MRLTTLAAKLPADGKWLSREQIHAALNVALEADVLDRAAAPAALTALCGEGLVEAQNDNGGQYRRVKAVD